MVLSGFWQCAPELTLKRTSTPALFIDQIKFALIQDNTNKIENLLIERTDLISTLTEEKKELVYNYDDKVFNMATDLNAYDLYKKEIINSFNQIKINNLNWESVQIKNAFYKTDSIQINITGMLVLKDRNNQIDSINFKGIKLLNNWSLTHIN
jgi:hypothetical protein